MNSQAYARNLIIIMSLVGCALAEPNGQDQASWRRHKLPADYIIPGVLISGINSELPGDAIGQITKNIYDPAFNRHLLIPKGTRILGSSFISQDSKQVTVEWERLVFSDGNALDLGAMTSTDDQGLPLGIVTPVPSGSRFSVKINKDLDF